MLRQSPFHARVAAANQTSLWSHWAGHLVVDKYQMSEKWEYMAIRNAAGVFDSSPLYKYRITGPDAERYLAGVLARDVRTCRPGQAQYTIWCDERGFVNEDGVVFRHSADEFLLTAAEPNLAYFQDLVGYDRVEIEEVSEQLRFAGDPGPACPRRCSSQLAPEVSATRLLRPHARQGRQRAGDDLAHRASPATSGSRCSAKPATPTRCGTSLFEAGAPHGLLPFGQIALLMARIEAGLLLIHVDFDASRLAENDEHRSTPIELGLQWMLKGIDDDTRPFIGRKAILRERADGTSRWKMMGLMVDPFDYHAKYTDAGMVPPKDHTPVHEDMMVYDDDVQRVGYATSFMYSPVLQRHIALARITARARQGRPEGQPRVHDQPPLRAGRCRTWPATRCSHPQRKTMALNGSRVMSASSREYDAIVDRRWAQRAGQRRLPRQVGAAHADPRAAPPGGRSGDHRGAAPGLQVHDVLVRPQPAAPRHRARARSRRARLHAAADAGHVLPDGERRQPRDGAGPQREHQRDRPPLQA